MKLIPPQAAAKEAAKGLALRRQFKRGGTMVGVARARDLKNRRALSPTTIKRMVSYFARHAVDRAAPNFGNDRQPSAGYIAWLLWGGNAGAAWAYKMKSELKK
jgi:hypothetical protein